MRRSPRASRGAEVFEGLQGTSTPLPSHLAPYRPHSEGPSGFRPRKAERRPGPKPDAPFTLEPSIRLVLAAVRVGLARARVNRVAVVRLVDHVRPEIGGERDRDHE